MFSELLLSWIFCPNFLSEFSFIKYVVSETYLSVSNISEHTPLRMDSCSEEVQNDPIQPQIYPASFPSLDYSVV
jgi:hypothetical protein